MPFDAALAVLSPLPANVAGQSALVLDMVEFYFRGGERWVPRTSGEGERLCLLTAIEFVRREIGCNSDHAFYYLARAIDPDVAVLARPGQIGPSLTIGFNDAPGRTYAEIATVLCTAKALAEIDAKAFDEVEKCNAADGDPIEVRVIDEALKILGLDGEKWIKGYETDKQHNHCMIGAIKLARRRLKVKNDLTKHFVEQVLRRDQHISYIPAFNDDPGRRFDHVREVMLLAKCEAISRVGE
jgi:hypothetical protein